MIRLRFYSNQARIKGIAFLILACSFMQFEANAQNNSFPYSLNKRDYLLLPVAASIYYGSDIFSNKVDFNLSLEEIAALDRNEINSFDRFATYKWNRSLNTASDVFSAALPIVPAILFLPQLYHQQWENVAALGVMYLETYFFTKGLTILTKSSTLRTRPYLYNTSFTADERFAFQGDVAPEAKSSFFSGHTSGAFAAAVFLAKTYTDIYGKSVWSKVVWTTSLSAAAFTGYCRIAAGEHFLTDVLVGAAVGSAVGYLIPVLHKNKLAKFSYSLMPNSFQLVYKF